MKNIIKIIISIQVFVLAVFMCVPSVEARENVTDWYIQDFKSEIIVNKDSSLDITEFIAADCGNASGKHGIFRVLPEEIKLEGGGTIKNMVKLKSITDFEGKKIEFSESRNYSDKTVTWKIGDPNQTVQGVNYYKISYTVKNAIRFGNSEFDELYWNLNGNFWDLETDNFQAWIIFPEGVNESNSKVEYYTGYLVSKENDLAGFQWTAPNVLEFNSKKTLLERQGITASVVFSKNIITPYKPGFWETYGKFFWFLLPAAVIIFCFRYWWKFGRDPKVDKAIMAEYDPPGNLTPSEMGVLDNGGYYDALTVAEIVNLATKGFFTIKETNNKILLFNVKDYVLTKKRDGVEESELAGFQKRILKKLFRDGDTVNLSDLKLTFPEAINQIKEDVMRSVQNKNLITKSGERNMTLFTTTGIITLIAALVVFIVWIDNDFSFSGFIWASLFLSGLELVICGILMRKRTPEGADLAWKIKGFKLFMKTVDKDRAPFYERENIFEKLLPYAIAFEMTDIWINRMKEIYGKDYFRTHAPAWYIAGNTASFDSNSFSSAISSLSHSISSNTSSSSGSGGSGGSGGGGGGGGGGGW